MRSPLGRALLVCLPATVALVGVAIWNPAGNFWKSVEPPKAQCEAYDAGRMRSEPSATPAVYDVRKLDRLVREPQNTVSNLGYVVAGVGILLAGRRAAARSLGMAGIFLGIGSTAYHASLLPEWRMVDILGVYAVLYGLLWLAMTANWPALAKARWTWAGVILAWVCAIHTGVHRNDIRWMGVKPFDSTHVFLAAMLLVGGLALFASRRALDRGACRRAGAVGAISSILALCGGLGDRAGSFWAAPDFVIQGHAVWHGFGAVALVALYEVFASTGIDGSVLRRIPAA